MEGPMPDWEDRYLFTHKGRWKTGAEPNDFQWKGFAVRNQQYRYVEGNALYDMQKDPLQFTNLAGKAQYADIEKRLRARLEERIKAAGKK